MQNLNIDLETYSSVDIGKCGAWKYIDSDDFEILLFGYSFDDDAQTTVVDVACGEKVPDHVIAALFDPFIIKHAYNAAFEFGCLSKVYGPMVPSQWRDTMFLGMYAGYTAGLGATGKALGLSEDKQKLTTGKALIRYFCNPCKPTKKNGGRTRNMPSDDPEKWELFKTYNGQDVVAEKEIGRRLSGVVIPDWLQRQWETDLMINMRGVNADTTLVKGTIDISEHYTEQLTAQAKILTGLDNPNSVAQLKKWLSDQGLVVDSLNKETVGSLIADKKLPQKVKDVLSIRQQMSKTSIKKYIAIRNCRCKDGRIRGLLLFYGANRTGRWAGRLVQVQNLPHSHVEPEQVARDIVKSGSTEAVSLVFGNVSETLSALIRTALIPAPGHVFIDADFSAIEARVISWLACETWRLDVFRTHGKIYEASASQMFGVPIEKIVKGNPEYELRARGKVAELALGYQGGVGAMRRMDTGHKLDDLSDDEVQDIVTKWRGRCPHIVALWRDFQDAAVTVIRTGGTKRFPLKVYNNYGGKVDIRANGSEIVFRREYDMNTGNHALTIELPSGRKLYYQKPSLGENEWGGPSILYMGVDQQTGKWQQLETYGGKITENIVQAVARDCLASAIDRLEQKGFPVVFHIHDEVVIDIAPFDTKENMLNRVIEIMTINPSWAEGLPLGADGWVGDYFKKD